MALLDSLDNIRDDERVAYWLVTVVRRLSWRTNRANGRTTPVADPRAESSEHDPTSEWARTATVHQALALLGEPCRSVIDALYFDPSEPSYADIATRLGRSSGGIGPLRGRCLERMRDLIGEQFA